MSSSSSVASAEPAAGRLLQRAFDLIEREAAPHARLLQSALQALSVRVAVGAEVFTPRVIAARLVVAPASQAPRDDVVVGTDLATALALFDAELTALAAVRSDRLRLHGAVEQLRRAGDAFAIFLHGLVRCPAAASLLSELRAEVQLNQKGRV